jgi:type IV pilus assembly protein PilA
MAVDWYYADAHNQQQGPVAANTLASMFRGGTVHAATLVWREGLAAWVPLQQVAAQLGLIIVGAAPASPTPATTRIVKPSGSKISGWVVAAIVVGCLVPVLGILAAIAIPAYQDYTMRAHVTMALTQARALKVSVDEFVQQNNRCPQNGEGDISTAESYATSSVLALRVGPLADGKCQIKVEFGNLPAALAGKELHLTRDAQGKWTHGSNLPPRYLPVSMR